MWRFLTAMLLPALVACGSGPDDVHESRFMMGTLVEFTIHGLPREKALPAIEAAAAEMLRVEHAFTVHGDGGNAVKAFNATPAGTPVQLPQEVDALLTTSLAIAGACRDAFTPAIGGLTALWGFSGSTSPRVPPSPADIRQALPGARSSQLVRQNGKWLRRNEHTRLDFGAIAKGYAIDRGIAALRSHGVGDAIINAGGDLRVIGRHGARPWRIGIRHPRQPGSIGWLYGDGDISIATSGDYENFFMYQGKRYHHIIDPRTGYPATPSISVSVVAASAGEADAWSTALFVLGPDVGIPLANNTEGIEAIWMDAHGALRMSDGMSALFHDRP